MTNSIPPSAPGPESDLVNPVRQLRVGVWLIPAFGVLTLWATFTHQPSPTAEFESWARYVTTDTFLAQHLAGSIFGLALYILGTASLAGIVLAGGRRARAVVVGFILAVLGTAGLLAGFGTAAFAQPAIGRLELAGYSGAQDLYNDVYGADAFAVLIGGAVLFSIASIVLARAAGAISGVPRWATIAFGASGPLIGLLGVAVGQLQTLGSLAAIAGGSGLALAVRRLVPGATS